MFVATWFAIVKAGGIVVATMPLLRAKELATIIDKAKTKFAFCDERLQDEMDSALSESPVCERCISFNGSGEAGAAAELEERVMNWLKEMLGVNPFRSQV